MAIYIYTDKFIREPWADTVLYVPMKWSIEEKSWNSTITNYTVTATTLDWLQCGYFDGNSRIETNTPSFTDKEHTLSVRYKEVTNRWAWIIDSNPYWIWYWELICYSNNVYCYESYYSNSWSINYSRKIESNITDKTNRHHLVFSWWGLYLDWNLVWTWNWSYRWWYTFCIWWHTTWGSWTRTFVNWYMSEVIIENKVRTAQEISDYYNQTKSNYWIQ